MNRKRLVAPRYGVAEIFGRDFSHLAPRDIRQFAQKNFKETPCPFLATKTTCIKRSGVCSLRLYRKTDEGEVSPVSDDNLTAVCPCRLEEGGLMTYWAGEVLLSTKSPVVLNQIPFLRRDRQGRVPATVGKIDMVVVHPSIDPLNWCALEVQAVYFSGPGMGSQFEIFKEWAGPGLPFPDKLRRPDFRSSGPKRLMPQLQVKVPTLVRWGRRTAVAVDLPFWQSLGAIEEEKDLSNCEVVWLVGNYEYTSAGYRLRRHSIHYTQLVKAVIGLTGGRPTTKNEFEEILRRKLGSSE